MLTRNNAMGENIFYNAVNLALESDYRKLEKLRAAAGTWQEAWQTLSGELRRKIDPEKEWARLDERGIALILADDARYPAMLKEISQPPFGLYAQGTLPATWEHSLAVVGTRKASEEGREIAARFGNALASRGICIVSGLALGIDAAAHAGALRAKGATVAVLGNGIGHVYPRYNEKIAAQILEENGAIVSEYPLDTPSLPYRFLERNRIVSGLTYGTLVVEAPLGSGSLVTARFALEENRNVFVIPGPINHKNFEGSHRLIRSGAELVTAPEDILEAMGMEAEAPVNPMESLILETMRRAKRALTVDKLTELTNLNAQDVNRTVSFLLLKNRIAETRDGYTA